MSFAGAGKARSPKLPGVAEPEVEEEAASLGAARSPSPPPPVLGA